MFVSSSIKEFDKERNLILEALKDNAFLKPIVLEKMGARPSTTEQNSLQRVSESEIYLGIFGKKYSELTVKEYRKAVQEGKPCFIYVKAENRIDTRLRNFIEAEVKNKFVYYVFRDFKELVGRICEDLQQFLIEVLYGGIEAWKKQQKKSARKQKEIIETTQVTRSAIAPSLSMSAINKQKQIENILSGQPQWVQVLGHVKLGRNLYKELLKKVDIPTYSSWFRVYDLVREGKLRRVRTRQGIYFYITKTGTKALDDYLKKKNLPLAATYISNMDLDKFLD